MSTFSEQIQRTIQESSADSLLTGSGNRFEESFKYFERKKREILELAEFMTEAEMEEDLYRALAAAWLELRFEWARYNQILQYQAYYGRELDQGVFYKSSLCSHLLGIVEKFLDRRDRELLLEFVEEPLDFLRPNLKSAENQLNRNREIVSIFRRFLTQNSEACDQLTRVQSSIDSNYDDIDQVVKDCRSLSRLQSEIISQFRVPISTLWPFLASYLHEYAAERDVEVFLRNNTDSLLEIEGILVDRFIALSVLVSRQLFDWVQSVPQEVSSSEDLILSFEVAQEEGTTDYHGSFCLYTPVKPTLKSRIDRDRESLSCLVDALGFSAKVTTDDVLKFEFVLPGNRIDQRFRVIQSGFNKYAIPEAYFEIVLAFENHRQVTQNHEEYYQVETEEILPLADMRSQAVPGLLLILNFGGERIAVGVDSVGGSVDGEYELRDPAGIGRGSRIIAGGEIMSVINRRWFDTTHTNRGEKVDQ